MTKVAIVYYSGFKGVTEKIAQSVAEGAGQVPETEVITIHTDNVDDHWQDLGEADAIIFGTPTYIGGPAAKFKEFIEKLAGDIWLQRLWLNKVSGGFTVSAGRSGDKQSCLQQLATYAAQMGMMWVPVRITGGNYSSEGSEDDLNRMAGYLGVMAQANIDQDLSDVPTASDLETAKMHGHHITSVARQYSLGRRQIPSEYDLALERSSSPEKPAVLTDLVS